MGLVGFDLLTALTIGRGGTYEDVGDRKRYIPSGREPEIYLYSRSGVPYCAKSAHGIDSYGDYQPVVCTPEAFRELTNPGSSPLRRRVDFRNDLLPLLFAEMQGRYYTHAAFLKGGAVAAASTHEQLQGGVGGRNVRPRRLTARTDVRPLRPRQLRVRRRRQELRVERRLPGPRLRHGRDRSRRRAGRRWQPGQGGPGGHPDTARPVALGHRVRRPDAGVLHRLPVQRARTHQPPRGGAPGPALPAASGPARRRQRSRSPSARTRRCRPRRTAR